MRATPTVSQSAQLHWCCLATPQHPPNTQTRDLPLSTAGLPERSEPVSVHCDQEVVWWRESSREEHQWTKEHMWDSVSSLPPHLHHTSYETLTGLPWIYTLTSCYTINTIYIAGFIFHIYDVRYPPEAPELQIRKMADLCFLVQHYELAYSCYHTAKKDFLSDQAMLYAAGALVRTHTHSYTPFYMSMR